MTDAALRPVLDMGTLANPLLPCRFSPFPSGHPAAGAAERRPINYLAEDFAPLSATQGSRMRPDAAAVNPPE